MAQPAYKSVALRVDNADFTGVNDDCSGSNKSQETTIFYISPSDVSSINRLSSGSKGLLAKLRFDAGRKNYCRTGVGSLANSLGAEKQTIRRWAQVLEKQGLIKVVHERRCCSYHLKRKNKRGDSIPLLAETMKRTDVNHTYKSLMCWISYRQGAKEETWAMQEDMAWDLGVSVRTIQRELAKMKARGEVQINLRRKNRKYGNRYALTIGANLGGRIFGKDPHTTQSHPLNKTLKAKSSSDKKRQRIRASILSESRLKNKYDPEPVERLLLGIRINPKVARPMAFIDKPPLENVVQAISNGKILRAYIWQRATRAGWPRPYFNLAGYVIRALNRARKEVKTIGTTRLFREASGKYYKYQREKDGREKQPRKTDDQVKAWVDGQKRALGVIA